MVLKKVVTVLLVLTLPIWFIPFIIGILVFFIVSHTYAAVYDVLWSK